MVRSRAAAGVLAPRRSVLLPGGSGNRGAGLSRSGGGRPVAVKDPAVGAAGFGGAVSVQDQGPAEPVYADLVVIAAQQDEVFEPGLAAEGAGGEMVDLAAGGGLVAAAG